ncbi:MAG: hypothetical protein NXI32_21065, partial [bacterium]|nr:hypothetical protein [bacterium]
MGTTEPKFGVVVAQSENTIRFKTLDLWDRSIYLPTREEQQGPLLFEASAEISVAEAIFVFRRYHEKQPRHQFHDNQNSIAPMMLESFVLAYLADRAGDQQRSRQIMQLLIQRNLAHGLTRERLSDAVAVRFLQQFTLDFSDLELSWADQLRLWQNFDSRLPEHAYKARVDRMLVALGSIAAEEVGHQAKWKAIETGQSELSPADQIRELVWQLRNQSGKPMGSFSFGDPLNDTREELSPGGRLIATGYAAVPELIEAIDNRSFTRSATQYSPDPLGNVFTVGEVAVFVLSDIAKRDFHQHLQPTAMFAEPEGLAIAKQEILQWWRDFEEHGELGLLTKRIRTAEGFEVLDIAKLLVEKYPDKALAILSPELARLDGDTCPWVLELIAAEPKREMEPLLRDLMNRQELSIRAAAAG